jgi:hypothetical protein
MVKIFSGLASIFLSCAASARHAPEAYPGKRRGLKPTILARFLPHTLTPPYNAPFSKIGDVLRKRILGILAGTPKRHGMA